MICASFQKELNSITFGIRSGKLTVCGSSFAFAIDSNQMKVFYRYLMVVAFKRTN
jgi:hypothetical protein